MTATGAKDVQGMFRRAVKAAEANGVDVETWSLEEGSVTYGRAWRLYRREPGTGGLYTIGVDSLLGVNRREAYLTLYGMARAFELVAEHARAEVGAR